MNTQNFFSTLTTFDIEERIAEIVKQYTVKRYTQKRVLLNDVPELYPDYETRRFFVGGHEIAGLTEISNHGDYFIFKIDYIEMSEEYRKRYINSNEYLYVEVEIEN